MLSRPQQILLKRAQREAGLSDEDYRGALETVAGCRSSTSPAFTDQHLDKVLSYFEAIHWRAVDAGKLQASCSSTAVFRRLGFWSTRNTRQETSRDRFNGLNLNAEIAALESKLAALGFAASYCGGIRKNVTKGRDDAHALHLYRAALTRTLKAKARHAESVAVTD
jgi:hypothetical protein